MWVYDCMRCDIQQSAPELCVLEVNNAIGHFQDVCVCVVVVLSASRLSFSISVIMSLPPCVCVFGCLSVCDALEVRNDMLLLLAETIQFNTNKYFKKIIKNTAGYFAANFVMGFRSQIYIVPTSGANVDL